MCDRFAARVLTDRYGCPVIDRRGRPVDRAAWDFQDLDRFVAAAPRDQTGVLRGSQPLPQREIPVVILDFPVGG